MFANVINHARDECRSFGCDSDTFQLRKRHPRVRPEHAAFHPVVPGVRALDLNARRDSNAEQDDGNRRGPKHWDDAGGT